MTFIRTASSCILLLTAYVAAEPFDPRELIQPFLECGAQSNPDACGKDALIAARGPLADFLTRIGITGIDEGEYDPIEDMRMNIQDAHFNISSDNMRLEGLNGAHLEHARLANNKFEFKGYIETIHFTGNFTTYVDRDNVTILDDFEGFRRFLPEAIPNLPVDATIKNGTATLVVEYAQTGDEISYSSASLALTIDSIELSEQSIDAIPNRLIRSLIKNSLQSLAQEVINTMINPIGSSVLLSALKGDEITFF